MNPEVLNKFSEIYPELNTKQKIIANDLIKDKSLVFVIRNNQLMISLSGGHTLFIEYVKLKCGC